METIKFDGVSLEVSTLFWRALDKKEDVVEAFQKSKQIASNQLIRQVLYTKSDKGVLYQQAIRIPDIQFVRELVSTCPPLPTDEFTEVSALEWKRFLLMMARDDSIPLGERIDIVALLGVDERLAPTDLRSPRTLSALASVGKLLHKRPSTTNAEQSLENKRLDRDTPPVKEKEATEKHKDKCIQTEEQDQQGKAQQAQPVAQNGDPAWSFCSEVSYFLPKAMYKIAAAGLWHGLTADRDLRQMSVVEFIARWMSLMMQRTNRSELNVFVEIMMSYTGPITPSVMRSVTDFIIPSGPFAGLSVMAACLKCTNKRFGFRLLAVLAFGVWEKNRELPPDVTPPLVRDFLLSEPPFSVNAINDGRLKLILRAFDWKKRRTADLY